MSTGNSIKRTGCLSCHTEGIPCDPTNPKCARYMSSDWKVNHSRPPDTRTAGPRQRTGCLSCHARGIRCNPASPNCSHYISSEWRVNHKHRVSSHALTTGNDLHTQSLLTVTWTGTDHERRSLHFFCQRAAPELSGALDENFWRVQLPQATLQDDAIKHAVAALGASHEFQLRKRTAREATQTEQLFSFALGQCNKAIQELLKPQSTRYRGVMRATTVAVLFACFEHQNRNRARAELHVQHCYQLLEQARRLREDEGTVAREALAVDFDTLQPLTAHYAYQGDQTVIEDDTGMDDSRERGRLRFTSLSDAQRHLGNKISKLSLTLLKLEDSAARTPTHLAAVKETKARYSAYLDRWERACSEFATFGECCGDKAMSDSCRVLRAHHLAATIFAKVDFEAGEQGWAVFTLLFKKIVNLLTDVVQIVPERALSLSIPQGPHEIASMGLAEPLYAVAARCSDSEIAEKARLLLDKLPSDEVLHLGHRLELIERIMCAATGRCSAAAGGTELTRSDRTAGDVEKD